MKPLRLYNRDREELTERHVQAVWYDRALRPSGLVTRSGSAVRVIDPGTWNLGAGPDFLHAVLEIGPERRRMTGDVEVHLRPSDWTAHGHGRDPAYRNVIAHVTWGAGPEPPDLAPGAVSIRIGRFMTADVGFAPEQIDLTAYPFARLPLSERPCFRMLADRRELADRVIAEAGVHRLEMKARRFATILASAGRSREQVFYEGVMAALGYRRNTKGFLAVAAAVPLAVLCAEPEAASAALAAAGSFVEWDRCGCRPRNSPEARLGAAGALFVREEVRALMAARDFSEAGMRRQIGAIVAGGLVGRGRAAAVMANVLVPLALAEKRLGECPGRLPAEDVSWPVRLTAFRLFGRDVWPQERFASNGLLIQGLLQIHRDCCLQVHPDCGRCPLVERWRSAS